MTQQSFYLTTPIYYINDQPHIGHAYTNVVSDVIARFQRLNGRQVRFLTGTDEHGQKVEKAALAKQSNLSTFTDQAAAKFFRLTKLLNLSNDDFIRTTQARHIEAVKALWNELVESENIYLGKYQGWYSVRDEAFYSKDELTADGLAPSGAPVEWIEEPSYFFALSKWQEPLLEFYSQNPHFIKPESRYKEIINFVKGGLQDLSISRTSFTWGIPVPRDGKHVIYVWLDALTNYLAALEYPKIESELYQTFWPADIHVIGKDITRFHAVYWPAFLLAAGLPLPKCILTHGWWTNEGQKISKSLGNVIDPVELVQKFGVDAVRYFLLREISFGYDGDFSTAQLITRTNTELGDKLGNLIHRTLVFITKAEVQQVLSDILLEQIKQESLFTVITRNFKSYHEYMQSYELSKALEQIVEIIEHSNHYIDHQAPWKLYKTDLSRMNTVLATLLEAIKQVAIALQPFVPEIANKILDLLAIQDRSFSAINKLVPLNTKFPEPKIVFAKYTTCSYKNQV